MNNHPRELSIVIPAYGRSVQLPGLLGALLADPIARDAEVLVIDDGSPVAVEPFIREALAPFPFGACLRKANGGGPSARNFGAELATGRLLLFVDQDLQLPADFATTLVGIAEEFGPAAISAQFENRLQDTNTPFAQWYAARARTWEQGGSVGKEIANRVMEVHPVLLSSTSLLIERDAYLQCGGMPVYPRTGVEDQALGLMLGRLGTRVLRTDRVKALHIEERADLARFCARQREGTAATVRLITSFPEVFGPIEQSEHQRVNGPVRPLRESPTLSSKKAAKWIVARFSTSVLFPFIAQLERLSCQPGTLGRLYSLLVAAATQQGWREGLRLEADRVS